VGIGALQFLSGKIERASASAENPFSLRLTAAPAENGHTDTGFHAAMEILSAQS
jgi:hypothetical protein